MSPEFRALVEPLHEKFERLRDMAPYRKDDALPERGVYLFMENGKPLYAGRSNNLRRRYKNHTTGGVGQSAFGRILACEALGIKRTYKRGAKARRKDPKFVAAFRRARTRIKAMEFRAIEECDPTSQALLEIYVAATLRTPYNDFGTS